MRQATRNHVQARPCVMFHVVRHGTCLLAGHSLGGAIAVLAAYDIAMQLKPLRLECVTFGAPRIGVQL